MLKKPYYLLEKRGVNRYYLINANSEAYLAIEGVFFAPYQGKKKADSRLKEVTQDLRVLKITPVILATIKSLADTAPLGEVENNMGYKEKRYPPVLATAVKDSMRAYYDRAKAQYDLSQVPLTFEFHDTHENKVIKELIAEGFELLSVEKEGSAVDTVTLMKSSPLGTLRFLQIVAAGRNGSIVSSASTYTIDVPLAKLIVKEVERNLSKEDSHDKH